MRVPFPEAFISKLPKGTKAQNECPNEQKVNCKVCGGWHHPRIIHLDYVGHAAITQRLLDVDPAWSWEPVAFGQDGLPKLDEFGGLWIRLTVCGVTRLGYGDAVGKKFGSTAIKEAIGDAIRNACMRFGAALDLWHKGDWEADTLPNGTEDDDGNAASRKGDQLAKWLASIDAAANEAALKEAFTSAYRAAANDKEAAKILIKAKDARKVALMAGVAA